MNASLKRVLVPEKTARLWKNVKEMGGKLVVKGEGWLWAGGGRGCRTDGGERNAVCGVFGLRQAWTLLEREGSQCVN